MRGHRSEHLWGQTSNSKVIVLLLRLEVHWPWLGWEVRLRSLCAESHFFKRGNWNPFPLVESNKQEDLLPVFLNFFLPFFTYTQSLLSFYMLFILIYLWRYSFLWHPLHSSFCFTVLNNLCKVNAPQCHYTVIVVGSVYTGTSNLHYSLSKYSSPSLPMPHVPKMWTEQNWWVCQWHTHVCTTASCFSLFQHACELTVSHRQTDAALSIHFD